MKEHWEGIALGKGMERGSNAAEIKTHTQEIINGTELYITTLVRRIVYYYFLILLSRVCGWVGDKVQW